MSAVNAEFDGYDTALKDITAGDASQFKTNVEALQAMQAQWAISGATAAPLYSALVRIYGQQTVNNILTNPSLQNSASNPFSPDMIAGLKSEAQMLQLAPDPTSYNQRLALFNEIATGRIKFSQLSEDEAGKMMPHVLTTIQAAAPAAKAGDPKSTQVWTNSYDSALIAARVS